MGSGKCLLGLTQAAKVVLAFTASLAATAQSAPPTISGTLNNRFSDNVVQSPSQEISDTESRLTLSLRHQSDPGACYSQTQAQIGYGVWWDDTYAPETYANGQFTGECELVRGLDWELSDSVSQVLQNSRGTDTPDNRTIKNVFRTGPRYTLFLGHRDQMVFSAQYQNTEFVEPEDIDSERYIGSAAWNHIFGQTLSGGISFSSDRAELDTERKIDTDVLSLNWVKTWAATRFTGSIGFSELTSRLGTSEQSSDGWVGQVAVERDVTPSMKLYLNASRELTDQTSEFDIRFEDFTFNLRQTSEVEVSAVNAGIDKTFSSRATVRIGVFANRADYLRVDQQEDVGGVELVYSKPIGALWSVQALTRYEYASYDDNGQDDQTSRVEAGLLYSLTKDLNLSGRIGHNRRESDVSSSQYEENWASLGVRYSFR